MTRAAEFRLSGVAVSFSSGRALSAVDLEIESGECVGLVGPSGAGKTTLLRLCNGMQRPTDGRVRVDGVALDELSRRELRAVRSRIGFVHQDFSLVPNLRVVQNVACGRLAEHGWWRAVRSVVWPSRDEVERIHELLVRVGIGDKLYERTDRLSGGQQQRVAIARAMYQRPGALLCDEPVSSVDPARARDTVQLLQQLARDDRLTLCMSLHNLELARELFPRLVGMRDGRIAFDRARDQVTAEELRELFDLRPSEMLRDGA